MTISQVLQVPLRIILSGRSNSGKTTLLLNLLMNPNLLCGKFDKIIIYSPTAFNQDKLWLNLKYPNPSIILIHSYSEKSLQEEEAKKQNPATPWLIIFDDCLGRMRGGHYTNYLDTLMARCRHNNISVILSTQSIMALSQSVKQDCDLFFIFEQFKQREIDNINAEFALFSRDEFKKILSFCTKTKYSFLTIHKGPELSFFKKFNKLEIN